MERSCSNFVSYLLFSISVFVNDMRETAQLKKKMGKIQKVKSSLNW